jgi:signal transduction histidine kinase
LRLTILYSGLFLAAGAALLAVNYGLVYRRETRKGTVAQIICGARLGPGAPVAPPVVAATQCSTLQPTPPGTGAVEANGTFAGGGALTSSLPGPSELRKLVTSSQDHTLQTLAIESGIALGIMAVASLGLGWLVAGRALRPVHRITDTARRLSQETLHERIDLHGPDDELKELADTFDAMLSRLDRAFSSQRRFVANASHELRTPLATERVLIDEALANREASPAELRAILEQLRINSIETEALISALLVLARSERGIDRWAPTDLAEVAADVVDQSEAEALAGGVEVDASLLAAPVSGDPPLLERLVGNLVENAVRHNVPGRHGGWVRVSTEVSNGIARLRVANSGSTIAPEAVAGLFEPFRRGGAERTSPDGGLGLGLSIVQSVVRAHRGSLEAVAPESGGLEITVSLPAARPPQAGDQAPALRTPRAAVLVG